MKNLISYTVVLMAFMALGGCATMAPNQQTGALLGGALGAGIPLLLEESASVIGGGALIGAAAGAVAGELFLSAPKAPKASKPTTVVDSPSGLEAIRAEAYAREKRKILLKRQRAAEKAAREIGVTEARAEMSETE